MWFYWTINGIDLQKQVYTFLFVSNYGMFLVKCNTTIYIVPKECPYNCILFFGLDTVVICDPLLFSTVLTLLIIYMLNVRDPYFMYWSIRKPIPRLINAIYGVDAWSCSIDDLLIILNTVFVLRWPFAQKQTNNTYSSVLHNHTVLMKICPCERYRQLNTVLYPNNHILKSSKIIFNRFESK